MNDRFSRLELLLGKDALQTLKNSKVLVFGVGGVGGYVCEALARCGVGTVDIVDNDTVALSNINRQIIALGSTLGRFKVDVMQERMKDINPEMSVTAYNLFYTPDNTGDIDFSKYDYIIDAIDTVTAKINIIERAKALDIPVISAMGAGNKLDPTKLVVTDIYKTSMCPLARVMRKELRSRGIKSLKVVYSTEKAIVPKTAVTGENNKPIPGSTAFVPPVAGLIIAREVINDILNLRSNYE